MSWHKRHEAYKKAKEKFRCTQHDLIKAAKELQDAAVLLKEGSSRALVIELKEITNKMNNYSSITGV